MRPRKARPQGTTGNRLDETVWKPGARDIRLPTAKECEA